MKQPTYQEATLTPVAYFVLSSRQQMENNDLESGEHGNVPSLKQV